MKNLNYYFILILTLFLISFSCKKKKADAHVPPSVVLKSGGPYTDADKAVHKKDTVLIGIVATKTEDDLKSYNASYTYDAGTSSTTFYNYLMTDDEKTAYSHDIKIGVRNQNGTEKWVFSIVDRDGNITQKTIVLTVN